MGKTILVSSHILPELAELCTSVGIIDRGRLLRSGKIGEIERSLRATALLRIELLSDATAAIDWLGTDHRVGDVLETHSDGALTRLDVPFDGSAEEQAALLRSMIEAGHTVSGFSQATSDLEEIFLKVTGNDEETAA
jgi:ABC-2 type transport system ATP-binding protein